MLRITWVKRLLQIGRSRRIAAGVAGLVVLFLASLFSAVPAQASASHTNTDPYNTRCAKSSYTLAKHAVSGGTALIKVSRNCATNWLEYSGKKQTTTKRIKDHKTNRWTRTEVDNRPWSYSMQSYAPGATTITATIKIGRTTTTAVCSAKCSWRTTTVAPPAPKPVGIIGDNYPHRSAAACGNLMWCVSGNWYHPTRRFAYRNCTDFVAYRLNTANKVAFTNSYRGTGWGNAYQWKAAAQRLGIKVNSTPARGAVAYSPAGGYGHVAWVTQVNSNGTIVIEQYNQKYDGKYTRQTVNKSNFQYIHIKDY